MNNERKRNSRRYNRVARQQSRSQRPQPRHERLESRRLLTVIVSFDDTSGKLIVSGTDNSATSVYINTYFPESGGTYIGVWGTKNDWATNQGTLWNGLDDAPNHDGLASSLATLEINTLAGNDTIDVAAVTKRWFTNPALDGHVSIWSGSGQDSILGSGFSEWIDGGPGGDTINGGKGNDTIYGSGGSDSVVGGDGADLIDCSASTAREPCTLIGGALNDTIYGGAGSDSIVGEGGDDMLYGNAGRDTIIGNAGNDYIDLGPPDAADPELAELANGGYGNDTMTSSGGAGATYIGGDGNDEIICADGIQTFNIGKDNPPDPANIVYGGAGNDTISGGKNMDYLYGQGGDDVITGGANTGSIGDSIDGGSGCDTLTGTSANDTITGGQGDDIINGKGGTDSLTGGSGNNYISKNDGVPTFPNDYGVPEVCHPAVGGLTLSDGNGNNTVVTGAQLVLKATGVLVPVKGLATVTKVDFYLDSDNAGPLDQVNDSIKATANKGSGDVWTATIPKLNLAPGVYTFFAIATASNGYQGNFKSAQVTVTGPDVMINAPVPQTQEMLAGAPGKFEVTRDGPTDLPLIVNYTSTPAEDNGTDYATLSGTVTIPAGSDEAPIYVKPLDDGDSDDSNASEYVTASLTPSSDYDIDPSAPSATVTINEEAPPTVTISANVPNAIENGADGEFTVSRTGPTDSGLTVYLASGGTATAGVNYASLPTSVTIPAGARSAALQVQALEDTPGGNDPEDVNESIQPQGAYVVGSPSSADVMIVEQPTSVVTIAATADAEEGSSIPGEFTVTRTAPYTNALTVSYDSVGGTAIEGTDYLTLPDTITIPAGAASAVFNVNALDDGDGDDSNWYETLTAGLVAGSGYQVGTQITATTDIVEEPLPSVEVVATTSQVAEQGSTAGVLTFILSAINTAPLTINYTFSGSAVPGTDFNDPGESVTIPAGQGIATVNLAPKDDGDGDDSLTSESVTATITSSLSYTLGALPSATVTFVEETVPQVTVTTESDARREPVVARRVFGQPHRFHRQSADRQFRCDRRDSRHGFSAHRHQRDDSGRAIVDHDHDQPHRRPAGRSVGNVDLDGDGRSGRVHERFARLSSNVD